MKGKFKPTILILFCLTAFTTVAKPADVLKKADSLFFAKKYTSAFEQYDSAFQMGQASPSMLLKMAFIKEGLGDYTQALYYLNAYYNQTAERPVLLKMQELADENSLAGYKIEDRHFFLNVLTRYDLEIKASLLGVILLLTWVIYKGKKKGDLAIGVPVIQLIFLGLLLTVSNQWLLPNQAIITEKTVLMSAPSAAAEPITPVTKGHKVEIIGQSDAWAKIMWEGRQVYVRATKLKTL